ncbi:hypothetical protein PIB30_094135, partial [Stylosanthes scabra]|nr:hypothetical protein [Stylosanthes scabra]
SFLCDPDRPYDLPISAIRPDRGISHPPPAPVDTGVIGEPYDPLYDLAGFIDEYYRRPPEVVPAQMEADPVEDPMDTDTGKDEDLEKAEQSEDSEDTHPDERSVVSTDTCESRAEFWVVRVPCLICCDVAYSIVVVVPRFRLHIYRGLGLPVFMYLHH